MTLIARRRTCWDPGPSAPLPAVLEGSHGTSATHSSHFRIMLSPGWGGMFLYAEASFTRLNSLLASRYTLESLGRLFSSFCSSSSHSSASSALPDRALPDRALPVATAVPAAPPSPPFSIDLSSCRASWSLHFCCRIEVNVLTLSPGDVTSKASSLCVLDMSLSSRGEARRRSLTCVAYDC